RHPPADHRLIDIPARLPLRNGEPARQHARRLRRRHTSLREVHGGVDTLGVHRRRRTVATHDMNVLPNLSPIVPGTPRLLQPAVTQRHIETEVAKCVGAVASPVLSNIYLDRLDQYVEQRLLPEYNLGRRRRPNRAYQVVEYAIARARRHKDRAEARRLILRRRQLPSQDPVDPGYRRLRYVRYADDWLLGFAGPRREAEDIKLKIAAFLREE